jgi:hypothetical protein
MDDWILATYGIPSITSELGNDGQYVNDWQNKSPEEALSIIKDNGDWIEHIYQKLGSQLRFEGVTFSAPDELQKTNQIKLLVRVTNHGLSDFNSEFKVLIGTQYTGTSLMMSHTAPDRLTAYNEFPMPAVKSREAMNVEIILPFNKLFLEYPLRNGLDLEFYVKKFSSSFE